MPDFCQLNDTRHGSHIPANKCGLASFTSVTASHVTCDYDYDYSFYLWHDIIRGVREQEYGQLRILIFSQSFYHFSLKNTNNTTVYLRKFEAFLDRHRWSAVVSLVFAFWLIFVKNPNYQFFACWVRFTKCNIIVTTFAIGHHKLSNLSYRLWFDLSVSVESENRILAAYWPVFSVCEAAWYTVYQNNRMIECAMYQTCYCKLVFIVKVIFHFTA